MTFDELVTEMCEAEGLKKQVNRAQMKEILSKLSKKLVMEEEVEKVLLKNGQRLVNKEVRKRGLKAQL